MSEQGTTGEAAREGWGVVVLGVCMTLLGAARSVEAVTAASTAVSAPGAVAWTRAFVTGLSAALLAAGLLTLAAGSYEVRRPALAKQLGLIAGVLVLGLAVGLGMFAAFYQSEYAEGGLVFGVLHTLTLTREATQATPAGIAGYKMGQAIGIAAWLGCAGFLIAPSVDGARAEDAP